jgi:Flp pilus assembly protein TadD
VYELSGTEINDESILGHLHEALERANAFDELNSTAGAEYACLRSMMLEPQNPTMWNALALVYMMSDRAKEAEEAIERSLDIDTSNWWTWTIWGDLLRQEGRLVEAERAYRMAAELNPTDAYTMKHLALLYSLRGAFSEAVDLYQRLIPTTPNNQELWDAYSVCLRKVAD